MFDVVWREIKQYGKENLWEILTWAIIGIGSFILGIIGYSILYSNLKLDTDFADIVYNTFKLYGFGLAIPKPDTPIPWQLEVARWSAGFFFVLVAAKAVMVMMKDWWSLLSAKDHIIICGAGEKGKVLGEDILRKIKAKENGLANTKLFYIDPDKNNPNLELLRAKGAVVVHGYAQEETILKKVKATRAKFFITVTCDDATNMEVVSALSAVVNQNTNRDRAKLKTFVHLFNGEFYDFFMANEFKKGEKQLLEIKIFNIYANAARMLYKNNIIGDNVDTVTNLNSQVKLAILGFENLAENILLHSLQLGHFYNGIPISVTVMYDMDKEQNKNLQDEFFKKYNIDNYPDYWSIKFIDDGDFFRKDLDYSHLIVAFEDESESLSNLMKILSRYNHQIIEKNIKVSMFSNSYTSAASVIDRDYDEHKDTIFKRVHTFGKLNEICTYDTVINETLDYLAKASNDHYNALHNYFGMKPEEWHYLDWKNLNLFLKDSNRFSCEHIPVKLHAMKHFLVQEKRYQSYEEAKKQIQDGYFYLNDKLNWDEMKGADFLAEHLPIDAIINLAKSEHKRWNAFYILNGWSKYSLEENPPPNGKDNVSKKHVCLVSWDELDKVSEYYDRNYKSDDIETIMRIPDLLIKVGMIKKLNDLITY